MKRIDILSTFLLFLTVSFHCFGQDKLVGLRTSKKIVLSESATSPYYAIQLLAIKEAPRNASFFDKIEVAKEWSCSDGYVRYTYGEYNSFADAKLELEKIKTLGYEQAFVVNTKNFILVAQKVEIVIDPNKTYTCQIGAYRYPLYLTFFKEYEDVQEYYMKDRIYRYCVGSFLGKDSAFPLDQAKAYGYKGAFLVEKDTYLPFKIE